MFMEMNESDILNYALVVKQPTGYDPGHPWYFALGDEPPMPRLITPSRRLVFDTILKIGHIKTVAQYNKKFKEFLKSEEEIYKDLRNYIWNCTHRGTQLSNYEKMMLHPSPNMDIDSLVYDRSLRLHVGTSLGLIHNHVCYNLSVTQGYYVAFTGSKYSDKFFEDYQTNIENRMESFYSKLYDILLYPHNKLDHNEG